MCTSLTLSTPEGHQLFGRTLDLETHFGEQVTLTRRAYRPPLFSGGTDEAHHALVWPHDHHALLGMAVVVDGYPLYAEAMNDRGLCMAGLRFARHARYLPAGDAHTMAEISLAPWELIPYLLGRCASVAEAEGTLRRIAIVDRPFLRADGECIPPAPLHWHICDRNAGSGSIVVEVTEAGMQVYDDPAGVLSNDPTFPEQMATCAPYLWMEPERVGTARPALTVQGDDLTLPGGYTSSARFIRAAYLRHLAEAHLHSRTVEGDDGTPATPLDHASRILGAVAPPLGAVLTEGGEAHRTLYTAILDPTGGVYTYEGEDGEIHRVRFDNGEVLAAEGVPVVVL